ncbi:MAG: hypothetical protein ABSD58_16025 [Verrucomicrobiia bacterium]|jgi:hypothetical protein
MGGFELAMRLFFGDKAYHLEESCMAPTRRNQWLRKVFKRITKDFHGLDSAPEHRDALLREANYLTECRLPKLWGEAPTWGLVYSLLRVIAYLLGYQLLQGRKFCTPTWSQDSGQYYTSKALRGKGWYEFLPDQRSAIARSAEIVDKLKGEGLDDFQISLVLNTTDYEVKKLKRLRRHDQPSS